MYPENVRASLIQKKRTKSLVYIRLQASVQASGLAAPVHVSKTNTHANFWDSLNLYLCNFQGDLTIYTGIPRHKEPCYKEPFRTMNVLCTHVLCTPDSFGSGKANLVIMNLQYNEQFEMLPKSLVYRGLPVARPHVLLYA